jgi:hypothetical protein
MSNEPQNSVEMGWAASPMKEQHPVLSDIDCKMFDEDNNAISRLRMRGLITPSMADNARKKYVKKVEEAIKKALKG